MSKRTDKRDRQAKRRRRRQAARQLRASAQALPEQLLCEAAEVEFLEAAEGEEDAAKPKRFTLTAYNGGRMRPTGYYFDVVVDLAGLTAMSGKRPVFLEHNRQAIVGHTTQISIDPRANKVTASGVVSGAGETAREVQASAGNGFPWRASLGGPTLEREFIEKGQTAQANGRTFRGPVYILRKQKIAEISFCPLAGDDTSRARIAARAANHSEEISMKFADWLKANGFDPEEITDGQRKVLQAAYEAEQQDAEPNGGQASGGQKQAGGSAPLAASAGAGAPNVDTSELLASLGEEIRSGLRNEASAESQRISDIRRLCASYGVDQVELQVDGKPKKVNLEAHAIEHNWSKAQTELEALRASRPQTGPAIHSGGGDASATVLEAAACTALGMPGAQLVADYGDQTLQAAHDHYRGRLGLQELLLEAAYANGYSGRSFKQDPHAVLQAAFSGHEISGLLSNVQNKAIKHYFEKVEQTWAAIADVSPVTDFKQITNYSLTGDMEYEEVGPDGELKHGKLGEETYNNQADTYGKIASITRKDLYNDDLGALNKAGRRLGRGGALKINDVFWKVFLDNAAFFVAGNNNYADGAATALGVDALTAAELLFLNQTDPDGKPLGADPAILLVPNALFVEGTNLMESLEVRPASNSTKAKTTKNPHAGKFQVEKSSYLSNASYTGASALAWYLLADPADLPVIEMVFLNGNRMPTVEQVSAPADVLGIVMRGYHDFGAAKQEPRGGVKMKGEA